VSAPLGRFVLVELHENLARHGTTSNVAKLAIKHVPGVASVTDLAAISAATLDTILMTPDYDPPLPVEPLQLELGA